MHTTASELALFEQVSAVRIIRSGKFRKSTIHVTSFKHCTEMSLGDISKLLDCHIPQQSSDQTQQDGWETKTNGNETKRTQTEALLPNGP
jgi:hypothetical protein